MRRIDWEKDYEFLRQKLGVALRATGGEGTDFELLRRGADTFLWESPLASSVEEAVDMARRAAADMAPGRVILAEIMCVTADHDLDLESYGQIQEPIVQTCPEGADWVFSTDVCKGQKGIRFLLAFSVESADEQGETP